MRKTVYDFVVIGAGVVGCAIARELATKYPSKKIIILEKLSDVGLETSRFNSGVLHSAFHHDPRSLKAKLARDGSRMAIEYMESNGLKTLKCGMLIALSGESAWGALEELPTLLNMFKKGFSRELKLKILTPFGIKKLEPNLRSWGGIFIPEVSVIDPTQLVVSIWRDASKNGVCFNFNSCVGRIEIFDDTCSVNIDSGHGEIIGKAVINAAGLYADEVAAMAGFNQYRQYPWRGEYYEVVGDKKELIKHLVYPVVHPNSPGKGIHFSPRVNGQLFVGPNARLVPSKNYYTEDKTDVSIFAEHIKCFCPEIRASDLKWGYSGIRPKMSDKPKDSDFVINIDNQKPRFINLIGIDSPGLSSSMAIARYVCDLL